MIDFHSHILPRIDDGSKSVELSLDMLQACKGQNIETIVATPHFYRELEPIDSFLARRDAAFRELKQAYPEGINYPDIILAAEVSFFDGISRDKDTEKLCIGNNRCLLLEMPFEKWNRHIIQELRSLLLTDNVTIIIAHVERYLAYENEKRDLYNLINMGAILQIDSSFINNRKSRKKAFSLLRIGDYFVLGSDCHNMSDRSPDLMDAREIITTKLGERRLNQIDALSNFLLTDEQNSLRSIQ